MTRAAGIDVSRWQGEIDWGRVAASGFCFAVIRATVGNYYTDPRFYENWRGAREAGLLVTAYHVVKPKNTAESQIERLFEVLEDRRADLPLVVDVELADELSPGIISGVLKECIQRIEQREGRKPIVYTGTWFWNSNVLRGDDWAACDLWIAHYGVPSPGLPADWSTWRFWQYSDEGRVAGVSSQHTDLNWFNGSYEELLAYANRQPDTSDEETSSGEVVETAPPRLRARVTNPTLRVRNGPGVQYEHVGDLRAGDVVDILAIDGDEVWVAIGRGQWTAFTFRGDRYMTLE